MATEPFDQDVAKREAARRALAFVESGMRLGLGTGSTASVFVELLGEKVAEGLTITGVATSERTDALARACGIPMSTLDAMPELDLTIDGADEYDPALRLIKGGGGALLREKIVACASHRMIVIADGGKAVETLGRFPLPIEINRFGLAATRLAVERAAARCGCAGALDLRGDGEGGAFVTDGSHFILDARFGAIGDPEALAAALLAVPGVVEHGLFIGIAALILSGRPDGTVSSLGHSDVR